MREKRHRHRQPRPGRSGRSWWRAFVGKWGWRAYAVPVLAVITAAVATVNVRDDHRPARPPQAHELLPATTSAGPTPTAASRTAQPRETERASSTPPRPLRVGALPAGNRYTTQGSGTYHTVPGRGAVVGQGPLQLYAIEVEDGITGIDSAAFAAEVERTLADGLSWIRSGAVSLQRVDTADARWRISLTSSLTVRQLCGYEIKVETSCWAPEQSRVVINNARWVRGAPAYQGKLDVYRTYLINHEVGHALGHLHAHACLSNGLAPVMMQQTIGTKSVTGQLCHPNPHPYPVGVADAPGKEEPDTPQNDQFTLVGG